MTDWNEIPQMQDIIDRLEAKGIYNGRLATRLFLIEHSGHLDNASFEVSLDLEDILQWLKKRCCGTLIDRCGEYWIGINFGH